MKYFYVIREISYQYTDEDYRFFTMGGIKGKFETEEDALSKLAYYERKAYSKLTYGFGEMSPYSGLNIPNYEVRRRMEKFDKYYNEKYGKSVLKKYNDGRIAYHFKIDPEFSDEEILEIRRISGVKFFELHKFDGMIRFYGIWLFDAPSGTKRFLGLDTKNWLSPFFYNSYISAYEKAREYITWIFNLKFPNGIKYNCLTDLSDTPNVLLSFLLQSNSFNIDETHNIITYENLDRTECCALNELLRDKAYEIREMNTSFVEGIEHKNYEIY